VGGWRARVGVGGRHLWFISFELSLRVSIVETIFVNVSNPKRDPSLGPI